MAYAHPAVDGHPSQPASRPSHLFRASPPDSLIVRNTSLQSSQESFNLNSRRLQLRNSGFRGTILPTRRISPFASSPAVPELFVPQSNEDNSPRTAEKRALLGESLPSSPVSILQELSNSSRRQRTPRQSLVGIFEDPDTKENKPPELTSSSWLNEAGVDSSPAARPGTPLKMMTTRKISSPNKENTPPPQSSPVPKQPKGRRKTRLSNRSTSFDASRYIEHLESELAALNTRVDALTCPTTTRAHNAKVRNLTNQVRSLRLEVSAWEAKFDERVVDEVAKRSEVEADLRRALRRLEHEKEAKDVRIQELEGEIEHAQVKVKEANSLATTNQDLERRVDTLTQLLAQSPTRQEYQHSLPSPDKCVPTQRTPRPRSMLPKISSSPMLPRRLSLNVPTSATWRSTSFQSTDSIPETPEESTPPRTTDHLEQDDSTPQPNPRSRPTSGSVSLESTSHESGVISSRPTSITSSTSSTSAPWSSSYSSHANEDPRSFSRARRMRRFPSGTGSLKPLILPTSMNGPSISASAPLPRTSFASSQGAPDSYFDPAAAFLSIAEIANSDSLAATPDLSQHRRSVSWARNQALNALEGKPYLRGDDEDAPDYNSDLPSHTNQETGPNQNVRIDFDETPPRQRLSLEFELSGLASSLSSPEVNLEQLRGAILDPKDTSSPHLASPTTDLPKPTNAASTCFGTPILSRHVPSLLSTPIPLTRTTSEPLRPMPTTLRHYSHNPRPNIPSQCLASQKAEPNTTVAFFSRLTALVTSIRDPVILARRILHNAWARTSTPKAHGGLGWWLMGLVYRSCHRIEKSDVVPHESDEEDDDRFSAGRRDSNIDWHQFYSAEASKQRRVRAFIGDYMSTRNKEKSRIPELEDSPSVPKFDEKEPQTLRPRDVTYDEQPVRCQDCIEPTGRRSLRLWLRFSLAVVLAIGVAIKDGPGVLLRAEETRINENQNTYNEQNDTKDDNATACSTPFDQNSETEPETRIKTLEQRPVTMLEQKAAHEAENEARHGIEHTVDGVSAKNNDDEEYWGWELTFENYTAEDFQDGNEPSTPAS